jgi:hypothetical protein
MADFRSPIRTDVVNRAQTEGTGRVVVDESASIKAKAINQAIGATKDVVEAKTRADVETEIESGLDEFFDAKMGTTRESIIDDMVTADQAIKDAQEKGDIPAVNAAQADFERIDRLRRLGNISASQAKLQAEVIARRHINENPFWRAEIADSYSTVMGLHDQELKYIDSLGAIEQKNASRLHGKLQDILIAEGYDVVGKSIEQMMPIVAAIKTEDALYTEMKEGKEWSQEKQRVGLYGDGTPESPSALKGMYNNVTRESLAEYNRFKAGEINRDELAANLQVVSDKYSRDLYTVFNAMDDTHVGRAEKVLGSPKSIIMSAIDNKYSDEYVQRNLNMQKNNLQSTALKNRDVATAFMMDSLIPNHIEKFNLYRTDASGKNLATALSDYTASFRNNLVLDQDPSLDPMARRGIKEFGVAVNNGISEPRTPGELNDMAKVVNTMARIVSDRDFNPEEMDNVLDVGSNPKIAEFFNSQPAWANTAQSLSASTDRIFSEVLVPKLRVELDRNVRAPAGLAIDAPKVRDLINMNTTDSGVVSFTIKEDVTLAPTERRYLADRVDRMNRDIATKINKASRTMAHTRGHTNYAEATAAILSRFRVDRLPDMTGAIEYTRPVPQVLTTEDLNIGPPTRAQARVEGGMPVDPRPPAEFREAPPMYQVVPNVQSRQTRPVTPRSTEEALRRPDIEVIPTR